MKNIIILALFAATNLLFGCVGKDPRSVTLSLASCEGYYAGASSISYGNVERKPEDFLMDRIWEPVDCLVLIQNASDHDIGIYRQWNSWGYYSIHFIVVGADGKQKVIKKGSHNWTMNFPDCFVLPSGMTHAVPICFSSKEWEGVAALRGKGIRIKAIFEQEQLEEDILQYQCDLIPNLEIIVTTQVAAPRRAAT